MGCARVGRRYGKAAQFPPEQLSAFFSIVKLNHFQAVSERLTMERSFEFFKELLLRHSVQRPPFSVGLFSFQEMKAITEWMMDSYYRHYKLYQVRTLSIPTSGRWVSQAVGRLHLQPT